MDYTNTFYFLSQNNYNKNHTSMHNDFTKWKKKWNKSVEKTTSMTEAKHLMHKYNPVFIARNHLVNQAIQKAVHGDLTPINKFLEILANPYQYQDESKEYMKPPTAKFEKCFKTFCGT